MMKYLKWICKNHPNHVLKQAAHNQTLKNYFNDNEMEYQLAKSQNETLDSLITYFEITPNIQQILSGILSNWNWKKNKNNDKEENDEEETEEEEEKKTEKKRQRRATTI